MRVLWTAPAHREFAEAVAYVLAEDVVAAQELADRILAAAANVGVYPKIGRAGRVLGTRELVVPDTKYVLAYRERMGTIEILRVLHGARRWPPEL